MFHFSLSLGFFFFFQLLAGQIPCSPWLWARSVGWGEVPCACHAVHTSKGVQACPAPAADLPMCVPSGGPAFGGSVQGAVSYWCGGSGVCLHLLRPGVLLASVARCVAEDFCLSSILLLLCRVLSLP